MPISYVIDVLRGVVRVEMTGMVAPAATVGFLQRLALDPRLRPAMPQLVDFTRVVAPPIREAERWLGLPEVLQ